MDDDLLEQRVRDLIDRLDNMPRQEQREQIYALVKEYQLAETKDAVVTLSDLSIMYDRTVGVFQEISLPFCVDGKQGTEQQRRTYSYLVAAVGMLHRLGLLKRNIFANLDQPSHEPIED